MPESEKLTLVFRRYFTAAIAVITAGAIAYCLYALRSVLLMVIMAGLLAYFLVWPVERLTKYMRRGYAVALVSVLFGFMILLLLSSFIPVIVSQVGELVNTIPFIFSHLEEAAANWRIAIIPGRDYVVADFLPNLTTMLEERAPEYVSNALNYTQSIVSGTATILAMLFVVPLLTLYFLLDSKRLKRSLIEFFSPNLRERVEQAIDAVNHSVGRYIYSRVILALFVGITTGGLLMLFGVPFAMLLGLMAFVGEFIPVIGPWISFVPIGLILLATDPLQIFVVGLLIVIIQVFDAYVLGPKIMGETMNLHPLTVVIAMLVGGTIGGVGGLLIAIPAAAALKVIFEIFVFRRSVQGFALPDFTKLPVEVENPPQ